MPIASMACKWMYVKHRMVRVTNCTDTKVKNRCIRRFSSGRDIVDTKTHAYRNLYQRQPNSLGFLVCEGLLTEQTDPFNMPPCFIIGI